MTTTQVPDAVFGGRTESACMTTLRRTQDQDLWHWSELSRVQDLRKVTGQGASPLKNWLLHFWGGKQQGGVDAALKIRGFWAPASAGLLAPTSKWAPIGSELNCTGMEAPGFMMDDRTSASRRGSRQELVSHLSAIRLLNEVIAYHVDKVLGLHTVPRGRLVKISSSVWTKWFSGFFCSDQNNHENVLRARFDNMNSSDPTVIIGWQTLMVGPLVKNPRPLMELGCGTMEPNGTDVGGGPVFLHSYYESLISGCIAFRDDQSGDCWATDANAEKANLCDVSTLHQAPHLTTTPPSIRHADQKKWQPWHSNLRVINLDNDKPSSKPPTVFTRPCTIPVYLRLKITQMNNFSARMLKSIRDSEPLLAEPDFKPINRYLSKVEPYISRLAAQFRTCNDTA